ncbi:unnamed protein product [Leptidea sinapis]|uniref:Uncharacterized protein n=1 Tax=Leptidea sinapis TaxID=189913 RepID=A0A5E4PMF2_9NEOP|nr:unnamed protein product [Leptidea sinapis]
MGQPLVRMDRREDVARKIYGQKEFYLLLSISNPLDLLDSVKAIEPNDRLHPYPIIESQNNTKVQTLQQREHDDEGDVAVALDPEHQDHEDQHERRLATHHHELGDHVREQDLPGRHARHPRAVQ